MGRGGVGGRRDARRDRRGREKKSDTTRRAGGGARARETHPEHSLELLDLHLLVLDGELGGLVHLGDFHAVLQRRLLGLLLARVGSLLLVALALLPILLGLRHRGGLELDGKGLGRRRGGSRRRREILVGVVVHHRLALLVDGHGVRRCAIAKERFFLKTSERTRTKTQQKHTTGRFGTRHRGVACGCASLHGKIGAFPWKDLSCSIH